MAEPFSGSELLLKKTALYARVKAYAQTNVERDQAECNTLSYSGDTYPLLGLQRLCHALALEEVQAARHDGRPTAAQSDEQQQGIADELWKDLLFSSFSGIQHRTAQPSVRVWDSRVTEKAATAASGSGQREAERRAALYAAETLFLDAASQLPTEATLLDPSLGEVAERLRRLHRKLHRMRHPPRPAEGEEQTEPGETAQASTSRRPPSPPSSSISLSSTSSSDDEDDGAEVREGGAGPGEPTTPLQTFYSRYRHVVAFANAARTTRRMLAAIRQAPEPTVGGGRNGSTAAAAFRPRLTAAQSMLQLVQQQQTAPPVAVVAANGGSAGRSKRVTAAPSADDRRAVLAYLKRVAWLQKQAESGAASSLTSKTPAERAREELAHTQTERANFSRKRGRKGDAEEDGEGQE